MQTITRHQWVGHISARTGEPCTHAEYRDELQRIIEEMERTRNPQVVSLKLLLANMKPEDECNVCVSNRVTRHILERDKRR